MSGIQNLLLGGSPVAAAAEDPDFEYVTLLLPGNGTNGAQNNTFLDSSANNFTITRNGNTTQGTFSPFSQTGWGNYFDGTGDYLTTATSASSFSFGTGDFTVEFWINSTQTGRCDPVGQDTGFSSSGWWGIIFNLSASGDMAWYENTNSRITASSTSWNNGGWNHVAVTRSGNSVRMFLNGNQVGSTYTTSFTYGASNVGVIAGVLSDDKVSGPLTGYISNLRILKGTAQYTANFTVPTAPLTAITNTSLLTCQSNRFIDNSTNNFTITRNGDVSVQAFSPFAPTAAYSAATNGGSGYFDENGDYLDCGNGGTDYEFGSGDFTIEGWFYCLGKSQRHQMIMVKGSPTTNNAYDWRLYWGDTANNRIWFDSNVFSVSSDTTTTEDLVLNAWNHIAVVRSGANGYLYLNGTRIDSVAASGTMNNSYTNVYVGAGNVGSAGQTYYNGYANGIRLLKGTAQYTGSTYTVPTSPFTAITNTELLLNFTNAGIYDAAAMNDLETVGNAQISNTTAKWGSTSMYFDGNGDSLLIPRSVNLSFSTGSFTVEGWVYSTTATSGSYQCIFSIGLPFQIFLKSGNIESYFAQSDVSGYFVSGLLGPASSVANSTWTHFAIVRNGTTFTCYVNGVGGTASTGKTESIGFSSTAPYVGTYGPALTSYQLTGYIQDLRVTKGVARYTANFTAPTAAFPLF